MDRSSRQSTLLSACFKADAAREASSTQRASSAGVMPSRGSEPDVAAQTRTMVAADHVGFLLG